jgi:hypothetical protein
MCDYPTGLLMNNARQKQPPAARREGAVPKERIQTAESKADPKREVEYAIDDTIDDSFPASDPPAWTTTGQMSVAAKKNRT